MIFALSLLLLTGCAASPVAVEEQTKAPEKPGTQGVSTGLAEYELNLRVALKLQAELEERGYEVLMIRATHDVTISNAERAAVANEAGAAAVLRIHANGAMTICMTPDNPFNGTIYDVSYPLSRCIVDKICAATGAKNKGVWDTDTMTGINWSQVPVTIIEMGGMSNAAEDELLANDDYQNKIVTAIADELDQYFGRG